MVFGSLSAIKENDVRRMIAYSSVAQIGYIYMGFGMGTEAGMTATPDWKEWRRRTRWNSHKHQAARRGTETVRARKPA